MSLLSITRSLLFSLTLFSSLAWAQRAHLVSDLTPFESTGFTHLREPLKQGDTYYFMANNPQGHVLWQTDGTPETTTPVCMSYRENGGISEYGDLLIGDYFAIKNNQVGLLFDRSYNTTVMGDNLYTWGESGLFIQTEPGGEITELVSPQYTVSSLKAGDSSVYFINQTLSQLMVSDGSPEGTRVLKTLDGSSLNSLVVGDVFLFTQNAKLWLSDGTVAGTGSLGNLTRANWGIQLDGALVLGTSQGLHRVDHVSMGVTPLKLGDANRLFDSRLPGKILVKISGGLYVSEGTEQGTTLLLPESIYWTFETSDGRVFLTNGDSLWITDGTPEGTRHLTDGLEYRSESWKIIGDQFYFSANRADTGTEPWRSDGTVAGTTLLGELVPGPSDTGIYGFFEVGDQVLINSSYMCFHTVGKDNTLLERIPYSGTFFQVGPNAVIVNSSAMYATDGTVAGTQLELVLEDAEYFSLAGDQLFYQQVTNTNILSLMMSDGTATGTRLLKAFDPVSPLSTEVRTAFAHDGRLIASTSQGIISSDGDAHGTTILSQDPDVPALAVGDDLYFFTRRGSPWVLVRQTNGTETILLEQGTYKNTFSAAIDGLVFFQINDTFQTNGALWVTQGTTATTFELAYPAKMPVKAGTTVLFSGPEGRLYQTDGTPAGTAPFDREVYTELSHTATWQNRLFFKSEDSRPWVSDGTVAGTYPLLAARRLNTSNDGLFVALDSYVAFTDEDGALWRSDGTVAGTVPFSQVLPGHEILVMHGLGELLLFFTKGPTGFTLWRSLGTPTTTYPLQTFIHLPNPEDTVSSNHALYFSAYSLEHGLELWQTDGTGPGTWMVEDLNPGFASSAPEHLVMVGAQLYFWALDPLAGRELHALCEAPDATIRASGWWCDDGSLQTAEVADAGAGSSYTWSLTGARLVNTEGPNMQFLPNGTGPVELEVTVVHPSGCSSVSSRILEWVDGPPEAATQPLGPASVCAFASQVTYRTTPAAQGTRLIWEVPTGATIAAGQGSDTIVVNFAEGIGEIRVTPRNSCGDGESAYLSVEHETLPALADAGPDRDTCEDTIILAANDPGSLSGRWSITAGPAGVFADPTDPHTRFDGIPGDSYLLRWTLSGDDCGQQFDEARITFSMLASPAVAGPDLDICGTDTQLEATTPQFGTGSWTLLSGVGGVITDPSDPHSSFSGQTGLTYQLLWAVDSGACGGYADTVNVRFYQREIGVILEGSPVMVIGASYTLQALAPSVGDGQWSIDAGPDLSQLQFADPTDPATTFTPSAIGTYDLAWTVVNGPCTPHRRIQQILVDEPHRVPTVITTHSQPLRDLRLGPDNGLYWISQEGLNHSDGTSAGVALVFEGSVDTYDFLGTDLLIFANPTGSASEGLYWSDGTLGNEQRLTSAHRFPHSGETAFQLLDGIAYFSGVLNNTGSLWRTDGTPQGTWALAGPTYPSYLVTYGNALYFVAANPDYEFWKSDGTEAGTIQLTDYSANGGSVRLKQGAVFNDLLYFVAYTSPGVENLCETDGTPEGTRILTQVEGSLEYLAPSTNQLFLARNQRFVGLDSAGTLTSTLNQVQRPIQILNDKGFFSDGSDMLVSDATTTTRLEEMRGTNYATFAEVAYADGDQPGGIWKTDGTPEGTEELTLLPWALAAKNFIHHNDQLYFLGISDEGKSALFVLSPPPQTGLNTPTAVCSSVEQDAWVADGGPHAAYFWELDGGLITDGWGTANIRFLSDGKGPMTVEVFVDRLGQSAHEVRYLNADPIEISMWGDPQSFQSAWDSDANGVIDIRDLVAHFSGCL